MTQFELLAILLILTATFSWLNLRLALLPHTIGLLVMGLGASLVVIGAEAAIPGLVSDEIDEDLRGAVVIGQDRTTHQDLDFAIRRIVELAQRSPSPGINDPTTALYCIDRLGEVLGLLASRDIPSTMRLDQRGLLRVLTEVVVLEDMACRAFAAIARYGIADADVVIRLAETLARLETSFPLAARDAIGDFPEQVLSASQDPEIHGFDRKVLSDLQDTNRKKS